MWSPSNSILKMFANWKWSTFWSWDAVLQRKWHWMLGRSTRWAISCRFWQYFRCATRWRIRMNSKVKRFCNLDFFISIWKENLHPCVFTPYMYATLNDDRTYRPWDNVKYPDNHTSKLSNIIKKNFWQEISTSAKIWQKWQVMKS